MTCALAIKSSARKLMSGASSSATSLVSTRVSAARLALPSKTWKSLTIRVTKANASAKRQTTRFSLWSKSTRPTKSTLRKKFKPSKPSSVNATTPNKKVVSAALAKLRPKTSLRSSKPLSSQTLLLSSSPVFLAGRQTTLKRRTLWTCTLETWRSLRMLLNRSRNRLVFLVSKKL